MCLESPLVSTWGFLHYKKKYVRDYKKKFGSYKKYLNLALQTNTMNQYEKDSLTKNQSYIAITIIILVALFLHNFI